MACEAISINIAGDMLGTIWLNAVYAELHALEVGGDIGTPSTPAVVIAPQIWNLSAESIFGNILVGTTSPTWHGNIRRLVVRSGDFVGNLSIHSFAIEGGTGDSGVFIAGDLDGSFFHHGVSTVGEVLVGGVLETDREIRSGGDLETPITLASNGLKGVIHIGFLESTYGEWNEPITIGATTLSPTPYYTNLAGDIGGGVVSFMPYSCYLQNCTPAYTQGGTPPTLTSTPASITLNHYGNVTWEPDENDTPPLVISRCDLSDPGCEPGDVVVTSQWKVINEPGTRNVIVALRDGQSLVANSRYSFQPATTSDTVLHCDPPPNDLGNRLTHAYVYSFIYQP